MEIISQETDSNFIKQNNITQTENILPGTFSLLSEAWGLYKQKVKAFTGIMFIPVVLSIIISLIQLQLGSYVEQANDTNNLIKIGGFSIMLILISIISSIFSVASQSALFFSIKGSQENIGILESYRKAFSSFFSYIWVLLLVTCIIFGGLLLFIIPGIIFMTSFSFAIIILINENERGMNALLKSREYVKGMWWAIFGRAFLAGVIISLPFYGTLGLFYILKIPYFQIITTSIFSLFLLPFVFSFQFFLYQHVRAIKGNIIVDTSTAKKAPFVLVSILTPIFIIGLTIMISIFSVLSALKKQTSLQNKTTSRLVATSTLGMELTTYTNDEFGYSLAYPKTWDKEEIQSEANATSVIFLEPDQGNGLLRATIEITTAHLPTVQNMETTVNNYKRALNDDKNTTDSQYTILEDSSTTFIGFPAHKFIATKLRTFDEGKTYIKRKEKSILFTRGATLFNVEYKKDIDSFDLMEPLAESIISTFVINKNVVR